MSPPYLKIPQWLPPLRGLKSSARGLVREALLRPGTCPPFQAALACAPTPSRPHTPHCFTRGPSGTCGLFPDVLLGRDAPRQGAFPVTPLSPLPIWPPLTFPDTVLTFPSSRQPHTHFHELLLHHTGLGKCPSSLADSGVLVALFPAHHRPFAGMASSALLPHPTVRPLAQLALVQHWPCARPCCSG